MNPIQRGSATASSPSDSTPVRPPAFVRLRLDNHGRTTARNVGVRIIKMHGRDPDRAEWIRSRPELDGRLLQPSHHLTSEPDLVDVFPYTVWATADGSIWEHFAVYGPSPELSEPPAAETPGSAPPDQLVTHAAPDG